MEKVPMEFKYEPCCGSQRKPELKMIFLGGHTLSLNCPECGNELRMPAETPEYVFSTLWNKVVRGKA